MKQLLIVFTFLLVFTVSITPGAMGAPDYPPTPSKLTPETINTEDITPEENIRTKPYAHFNGGFDGTAEGESIKMWFCGNNPFGNTSQGAGAYNYQFDGRQTWNMTTPGLMDQSELRQSVIQKCMKAEKYIDWHTTDTVYVVIYAPGFNEDPLKTDYIGNKQYNEIFCTSDASPTVGMWRNEGGREGAAWGYQSWIADNGGKEFHASLYQDAGGFGDFRDDKSNWDTPSGFDWHAGDYRTDGGKFSEGTPGYMKWWSNLDNAGLASVKGVKEIGTDSGVFAGSVSLVGIKRFMALPEKMSYGVTNVDYNKQFTSGSERSFTGLIGSKICSIQTDRTGAFTIAWEYSEDKYVSKTAYYTMKEGEVKFGDDIVTMDQQVSVILSDRDVSSRPWDSTPIEVHVWSDSDEGGIQLQLRHERDWWVMQANDQTFYGTLFLTSELESLDADTSGRGGLSCWQGECYERGSARLHAQPGDHIYVHYKDYTLPKPYGIDGCTMDSADFTVDIEPTLCDHLDIYNFAKVKEASPLSDVSLTKVSINTFEKPYVSELNDINDDIHTWKRLVKLEENRISELGFEPTIENMLTHSKKYAGLLEKLDEFHEDRVDVKEKLRDFNSPNNSKTFVEGESVYITGTFTSSAYSPKHFVFAAQAEHVETGHIEHLEISDRTKVTKKKSVDVELGWTPDKSGEYVLKLYVLDAGTMGAVLKDPIINYIHVEPANSSLASLNLSSKN